MNYKRSKYFSTTTKKKKKISETFEIFDLKNFQNYLTFSEMLGSSISLKKLQLGIS